jgi:conjugal transfer pilus assembly protein TraV
VEGAFRRTALGSQTPLRTGERVLRIVFPPRINAQGRYREAYAVHAVVRQSVWADTRNPDDQQADAALLPTTDTGLAELAASAPTLAISDSAVNDPLPPAETSTGQPPAKAASIDPKAAVPPSQLIDDVKRSVERLFAGQKPATSTMPAIKAATGPGTSPQTASTPAPITESKTVKAPNFPGMPESEGDK